MLRGLAVAALLSGFVTQTGVDTGARNVLQPAAQAPGPSAALTAKVLQALEASKLRYQKVNEGLWGVDYEGDSLPSFTVHVEPFARMVVVWCRVREKADLSAEVMKALLEASFLANFSKIALDDEGDVLALTELPEDFTVEALTRAVAETADLADTTASLIGMPTGDVGKAIEAIASDGLTGLTPGAGATLPILGGAFEISYDPAKWKQDDGNSGYMVHQTGEAWFAVISERLELTLDRLRDGALENARRAGSDFSLDGESTRIVNGLTVRIIRYTGVADPGLKATFLSLLYSDDSGSVQLACWTSSNLLRDYEPDFMEVFAGFRKGR